MITSSHTASAALGIGGVLDGIGTFEVLALSWGASVAVSTGGSGGTSVGKPNLQDVSLTRFTDELSPEILEYLLQGKHVSSGSVTIKPANRNSPSITYGMENILFTSYSSGGSDGEDRLTENISMTFSKLTYTVGSSSTST